MSGEGLSPIGSFVLGGPLFQLPRGAHLAEGALPRSLQGQARKDHLMTAEHVRLEEARDQKLARKK